MLNLAGVGKHGFQHGSPSGKPLLTKFNVFALQGTSIQNPEGVTR